MANGIVLNIDTTKSEFQNPMVQLRQGDGNYQSLSVTVTSNGEPFDLTGWTITFMGTTAGGFKIVDAASVVTDAVQGEFTYTPTKAWGQDEGEFKNAYFNFTKADETASGASFRINVLDAVDFTAEEAGDYISIVDQTINKLTGDLSTLQTSVDQLKSQNNNIKTSDNTWTGTNTFNKKIIAPAGIQGNADTATTAEKAGTANDPEAIHVDSFGSISDFKQPIGAKFVDKLNNEFSQRVINVKWFGVKGDGVTDDSDAIINAISSAGSTPIIFPAGTYLISKSVNLQSKTILGAGIDRSILKLVNVQTSLLTMLYNNKIYGFTFDISGAPDGAIAIEMGYQYDDGVGSGDQYFGAMNNIISDIVIKGDALKTNSIGLLGNPRLLKNFNGNATGVYNNAFANVQIRDIGTGLYLDAQKNGWINSNNFDNILITNFSKNAVWIGSSVQGSQGVQANKFNNLQLQRSNSAPASASTIIIHGISNNHFNDIFEWNDSGVAAHSRPDVVAIEFQPDQNGSFYSTLDNLFSGKVEGTIKGDKRILDINDIDLYVLNAENNSPIYYSYIYNTKVKYGEASNEIMNNLLDVFDSTPRLTPFLFIDSTGIVWPTIVEENHERYIKLNQTTGSYQMIFTLFANYLKRVKKTGIFTFSLDLYVSQENTTNINFDVGGKQGSTNISLNGFNKQVYIEKKGDNLFSIHLLIDTADTPGVLDNLDSINVDTLINMTAAGSFVGVKGVYMTNQNLNHLNRYTSGHQGAKIRRVLAAAPTAWSDLGVFPLDIGQFEHITDKIYSASLVSNGYIVEAEYLE